MTFNAELVGTRYPEVRFVVDETAVREFAAAIDEHAPIFLDAEAARAAGSPAQMAPPTILAHLQIVAVQEITSDPSVHVGFEGIVHAEQWYEWVRPVYVGDVLSTIPVIDAVRTRASVAFMDVRLDVHDAQGELVVRSGSTLLHLSGGA